LWRGRKAKQEGLRPYLILNKRELAELIMKHPANITQLREIEGKTNDCRRSLQAAAVSVRD